MLFTAPDLGEYNKIHLREIIKFGLLLKAKLFMLSVIIGLQTTN